MPLEKCVHIADKIIVVRSLLHSAWLPLHVHQAHRQTAFCSRRQRTRLLQRTNVVNQMRPRLSRLADHPGFRGIHRDKNFKTLGNRFDYGHHSCDLFLFTDLRGSRPGRLAPHINHGRTGRNQRMRMQQRLIQSVVTAAVRERIRGYVEDPHHSRVGKIESHVSHG
ncbi:hypothetical protein D3C79_818680 [compost metagenome]